MSKTQSKIAIDEKTQEALLARFQRYTAVDTRSENDVEAYPSTEKQKNLGRILIEELKAFGLNDASMDRFGYVTATLKSNRDGQIPAIGFIAHLDTAPDLSGENVRAIVHRNYRGGDILFEGAPTLKLSPADCPALLDCVGEDIITADGTTLLGGDDKAGIAAIMTALDVLRDNSIPHGDIKIAFTPDEEVGRGTEFFDTEAFGVRYAYTVDGGTAGELSDETFNANTAIVSIQGVNIHPGKAKDVMVNAIQVLGDFLAKLPREMTPQATEGREGFIHPISVEGEVDKLVLKMILRDFEPDGLDKQRKILEQAISEIEKQYPKAAVALEIKESYRNMREHLAKDPRVVQFALDAMAEAGLTPLRLPIRGGTDGAELSRKGVLTPNLFYGGSNFHSLTEWVSLQQMGKASEVLVRLARLWAEK